MKKKKGFTLVELLAVIVILAVILIIAVPRITDVINNSKKASFEASAKTIASQAEKKYMEQQVLGNTDTISCTDIASINSTDYASCTITFDESGNALVSLIGSGKFAGLVINNATKNSATATELTETDSKYFNYEVKIDGLTDDKSKIYDVTVENKEKCVSYSNSKFGGTEEQATTLCTGGIVEGYPLSYDVQKGIIPSSDYEDAGLKVDIYNKTEDVTVVDKSKCEKYASSLNFKLSQEDVTTFCTGGYVDSEAISLDIFVSDGIIPSSDYETVGIEVKDVYKSYDVTVVDQNKCIEYILVMYTDSEEEATTFCTGGSSTSGLTLESEIQQGYIPSSHYETAGLKVTTKTYDKGTITITGYNTEGGLDVVIPSYIDGFKVTTIANNAFEDKGIKSVVIPDTVKTIGDFAFANNQLTSITFPTTPITITDMSFYNNPITNSETYTYPENVTVIVSEPD